MPRTRHHSYDLNFELKIVEEAEAVNNNQEIAREYRISSQWYADGKPTACAVYWGAKDDCQTCIHGSVQTKRSTSISTLSRLVKVRYKKYFVFNLR